MYLSFYLTSKLRQLALRTKSRIQVPMSSKHIRIQRCIIATARCMPAPIIRIRIRTDFQIVHSVSQHP